MHGKGTCLWVNGDKYEGQWKDGKMSGQGIKTWVNGDKYEGEWKDGRMDGHGTKTYVEGHKYVGQWNDCRRVGQGTLMGFDITYGFDGKFNEDCSELNGKGYMDPSDACDPNSPRIESPQTFVRM